MKRLATIILALGFAFMTIGCDTLWIVQYRVLSVVTPQEDEKLVREMLARIAAQVGFDDMTSSSIAKDTLVYYSRPSVHPHFRVHLGARMIAGRIIIDLHGGFGPKKPDYEKIQKLLRDKMERRFRGRYEIPKPSVAAQEPNKAPEPTTRSGTPRAFVFLSEMKRRTAVPNAARVAPERVVAHL